MKKLVTREVDCCDRCESESFLTHCKECNTAHCYDCRKEFGVGYQQGLYVQGSDDGYYCRTCDNELTKSGADELHAAYLGIKRLRLELDAWSCDFERRKKKAEESVRLLQVKR